MTAFDTKLILTENGEEIVPLTSDEISQRDKDRITYQTEQTQIALDAQISADARTSGIEHAKSLGFTPAQAEAMFP